MHEYDGAPPKKTIEFLKSNKDSKFILKIGENIEYFEGYLFKDVAFSQGKFSQKLSKEEFKDDFDFDKINELQLAAILQIKKDTENIKLKLAINTVLRHYLRDDSAHRDELERIEENKIRDEETRRKEEKEKDFEYINGFFMTKSGIVIKTEDIKYIDTDSSWTKIMVDGLENSYQLTNEEFLFLKKILRGEIQEEKKSF